jgi:capsular exopolysaccharide synthesis family protein
MRLNQRIGDLQARIDRMRSDYQLNEPNLVPIKRSAPPEIPNNTRPEVASIFAGLLGGTAGAAFILLWAMLNNKVSSVSDWQKRSDIRVLGEIPNAGRMDSPGKHIFLVTHPTDAPAEGIRMLLTGLDFASFPTDDKKVLQVTSPGPSNGKTTISANLAVHFAQLGKRVALVDCDLHRPRLHSIFSVSNESGLTTLIMNRSTRLQDVAARVALPGLFLIPSGALPPNPAELFSSDRFKLLLAELKADFDVVILDTPPVLLFSDSHRIASRSDAVLAVGRLDQTNFPDMDSTVDAIEKSGTELLGTVWVGSKPSENQYYYRNRRPRRFAF